MNDGKLSQKQKAKLKQLRQNQKMEEATYESQNLKKKGRGRPKKVQPIPTKAMSQKKQQQLQQERVAEVAQKKIMEELKKAKLNLSLKQKIVFKLIDLQTQLRKLLVGLKLRLKSVLQSLKLESNYHYRLLICKSLLILLAW